MNTKQNQLPKARDNLQVIRRHRAVHPIAINNVIPQGVNVEALYNSLCEALDDACTADEVKDTHDKAEALRHYAKMAKNREMEIKAAEIRIRAERRLGEMIGQQKVEVGLNRGGRPKKTPSKTEGVFDRPTLLSMGIDYKLSSRSQEVAKLSEHEFERWLRKWREEQTQNDRVTMEFLTLIQRGQARERRGNNALEGIKIPDGKFGLGTVDFPWPLGGVNYDTMTIEEILGFDLPVKVAAENFHFFLWVPQTFVKLAFEYIEKWEFEYKDLFTWHKNGGRQSPNGPQRNSEHILYATKGRPEFLETTDFQTCFYAPRRGESEKPEFFYDLLRRVTAPPRIDIFNRRPIEGFVGWGDEAGLLHPMKVEGNFL